MISNNELYEIVYVEQYGLIQITFFILVYNVLATDVAVLRGYCVLL